MMASKIMVFPVMIKQKQPGIAFVIRGIFLIFKAYKQNICAVDFYTLIYFIFCSRYKFISISYFDLLTILISCLFVWSRENASTYWSASSKKKKRKRHRTFRILFLVYIYNVNRSIKTMCLVSNYV
jgi:hypothetical protein